MKPKPSQAVRARFDIKNLKSLIPLQDNDDESLVIQTRNQIIFYLEELEAQEEKPKEESSCDEWIHKERVRVNDDKYCPICGENLQTITP